MISVKIKRLRESAIIPTKAHASDAGWDFYAPTDMETATIWPHGRHIIKTGISLDIPEGWYLQIMSRSGLASKYIDARAGVIDCSYRGEIGIMLHNDHWYSEREIKAGDKIAQGIFIPVPVVLWNEVDSLDETERGDSGYGSSGR